MQRGQKDFVHHICEVWPLIRRLCSPPGLSFRHPGVFWNNLIKALSIKAALKDSPLTATIFIPCQHSRLSQTYPYNLWVHRWIGFDDIPILNTAGCFRDNCWMHFSARERIALAGALGDMHKSNKILPLQLLDSCSWGRISCLKRGRATTLALRLPSQICLGQALKSSECDGCSPQSTVGRGLGIFSNWIHLCRSLTCCNNFAFRSSSSLMCWDWDTSTSRVPKISQGFASRSASHSTDAKERMRFAIACPLVNPTGWASGWFFCQTKDYEIIGSYLWHSNAPLSALSFQLNPKWLQQQVQDKPNMDIPMGWRLPPMVGMIIPFFNSGKEPW